MLTTLAWLAGCGSPSSPSAATLLPSTTERQAAVQHHPADRNQDQQISIGEVTAYGAAWKSGATWATEPNPIPIGYVTNAGAIWKSGEAYHADQTATPPFVPGTHNASPLFEPTPSGFDTDPVVIDVVNAGTDQELRVARGELVVALDEIRTAAQEQAIYATITAAGGIIVGQDDNMDAVLVRCPSNPAAQQLRDQLWSIDGVVQVAFNSLVSLDVAPLLVEEPVIDGLDGAWWIAATHARSAWGLMRDTNTPPVTVGVVDTGLDDASMAIHFAGKNIRKVGAQTDEDDGHGHGTFVASLAVATGDDGESVAGVSWDSPLLVGRVKLDEDEASLISQVLTQISACLSAGARVVNISISGTTQAANWDFRSGLAAAVRQAARADALLVFSAGNDYNKGPEAGQDKQNTYLSNRPPDFPEADWQRLLDAFAAHTIIVGALDSGGQPAAFSDRGQLVRLWAPGVNIAGARDDSLRIADDLAHGFVSVNSRVARANGTSYAAPLVTGTCALLWQLNPHLTAAQVRDLLIDPFGAPTQKLDIGAAAAAAYRGTVVVDVD